MGRRDWALLIGFGYGIAGVLVDMDHVLCAINRGQPVFPLEALHGCKIWHSDLLLIGGVLLGVSVPLLLGHMAILVINTLASVKDARDDKSIG